jgi:FkbM family methyltransferase
VRPEAGSEAKMLLDESWRSDPEALVSLLYRLLLGREPEPEGLNSHVGSLLANRLTPEQLAREFARSAEFAARSLTERGEVRVRALDCEFVLPAGADLVGELTSPQGYEPWVLPYFLEHCRPGMAVLDVGASWGAFALPAARRVGGAGRVFALEVSPRNCQVLYKSLKASGITNLQILPFGVSDRLGSEFLRKQDFTNNNSIDTGADAGLDQVDDYDVVPVLPIDSLRSALGPVHVVKMDIEGMEYRASLGGLCFFRECKPLVFTEYSPRFQKHGSGVEGEQFIGLFLDLGYDIEILHRNRPRELVSRGANGDVAAHVDAAWRRHVDEDQGTHLDLCLHPRPNTT